MTFTASAIFKCPFPGASTFTPSCGRHRRPSPVPVSRVFPVFPNAAPSPPNASGRSPAQAPLGTGAGRIARCVAFCDWLSHSARYP